MTRSELVTALAKIGIHGSAKEGILDSLLMEKAANVAEIADTSLADAEAVGDVVNALIASLVAAGVMEAPED